MADEQITPEARALTKQPKAFTLPPTPELSAMNAQLGGVPGVSEFPTKRAEFKTSADVSAEQEKQLGRLGQVEAPILSAQQAGKQYEADVQSAIATQSREQAQDIEAGLDLVREKFPYPQFKPTQENMQSLATLFSLVGMIGVAVGGAGKNSAMGALNSMTGMMKGWQQGRADIWKREKEEFDKNMAKTKAILDDAYKDADRAYKTLAYNREEAAALAGQSVAKLGTQVGKQILDKQGIERYLTYLDGVRKDLKHAEDLASQEKREEKRIEAQATRDAVRFAQQEQLQKERFAEQEKLAGRREAAAERRLQERLDQKGSGLKPGAEATKNYVGEAQLASDLKSLKDQLKDKELRKLVQDYRLESFLSEEGGKVGNQLLQTEIPSKLRKFISQAQSVRNNVYLSISGKAVTGGEAMRNYGTVPQPGDTPEVIDDKIGVLLGQINNRQAKARKIYGGLPDLSDISTSEPGFNVNSIQIETPQYASPSGPAVGSIQNGYRFKGGDPSKSDNWEKVK